MLLAIDVGNTNVTIGVFDGDRLVHSWRLAALRERTADEMGIFVKGLFEQSDVKLSTVSGIALASVVPPLTRPMEEMAERYFKLKPLTVDATNAGMPVHYSPVGDVGADRIVNAVAAWEEFGRGKSIPLIVVDFGTGTTFDVISNRGEYLGGSSVLASGSPRTRCSSARRACPASRSASRRASSARTPSTRCSPACSSAMSRWSTAWFVVPAKSSTAARGGGHRHGRASPISFPARADPFNTSSPNLTLDGLRLIWDRHQTAR